MIYETLCAKDCRPEAIKECKKNIYNQLCHFIFHNFLKAMQNYNKWNMNYQII